MNGVLKLSIFSTHVFLHEKRLLFMRRGRQGACLGMQIALENNLINVLTSSYLFFWLNKKGVKTPFLRLTDIAQPSHRSF